MSAKYHADNEIYRIGSCDFEVRNTDARGLSVDVRETSAERRW
jgi:hypothetical protein